MASENRAAYVNRNEKWEDPEESRYLPGLKRNITIRVLKNRMGELAVISTTFDPTIARFTEDDKAAIDIDRYEALGKG